MAKLRNAAGYVALATILAGCVSLMGVKVQEGRCVNWDTVITSSGAVWRHGEWRQTGTTRIPTEHYSEYLEMMKCREKVPPSS